MADSDSDDNLLSADFLEPGELLDSEDEYLDDNSTAARTSQSLSQNRPKVIFQFKLVHLCCEYL